MGFPGGFVVKNPPANARGVASIPRSGRSLGIRNGNPLQYSYLGNHMDIEPWQVTGHGVAKSWNDLMSKQQQSIYTGSKCIAFPRESKASTNF